MSMRWTKKAILAKNEGTYAVDAAPANADAVLFVAQDVKLSPLNATKVPREVIRGAGQFGAYAQFLINKHVALEFSVEMAGSGTPASPPGYNAILEACAMLGTVTGGNSVVYSILSDEASHKSVSLYFHIDGIRHKMLGCRGDVSWIWTFGERPVLRFKFLGLFVAVADAAFPVPVFTAYQAPMVVTDANTPTLSLHGQSIVTQGVTINLGNKVEYNERVNLQQIKIVDRVMSGQITFEHNLVATKDWFGIITAETQGALQVIHGVGGGKICQGDAAKVQLDNPQLSESQNATMLTLDLTPLQNAAADDEWTFTTK